VTKQIKLETDKVMANFNTGGQANSTNNPGIKATIGN